MIRKIFELFITRHKLPQNEKSAEVKYLIAGLGNIGPDYQNTRHNVGFMAVDEIARLKEATFESVRYGDVARFRHKGRTIILLKPSTYMNLSGKSVHYWLTKENIELDKLLVITDDVALPLGTLRLKARGSDGGHNGLANIFTVLGTNEYARLRFGIGNNYSKGGQVNYVLGKWLSDELELIRPQLTACIQVVESLVTVGIERTMNSVNTRKSETVPRQGNKTDQNNPDEK